MTSHRDAARGGFTLIEMMIVLAILGLAVGLALPLLAKRAPGAAVGGAAQELRVALAAARSAAIAEDREIWFSPDPGGYRIDGVRHPFAAASGLSVALRGGARIAFFPSGGSSGGRITVSAAAARREIDVEAVTGHAILLP